jgi:hypothetical protein
MYLYFCDSSSQSSHQRKGFESNEGFKSESNKSFGKISKAVQRKEEANDDFLPSA